MFYFGSSTGKGEHNWLYLSTTSKTSHIASEQYHRLNETKCSSYISVAYVDAGVQYYISDYSSWGGMQMEATAEAGCLYSVYKEGNSDKIYKNVANGATPHFSATTVNKTVGTTDSEIEATAETSIYGNEQVLFYYYTTDGGTTFTKFDPSDISSLAVGVYTVYALGWDGHILVRSDNSVTLNVGVTITLNANGGTDGDVTSVFATSGADASTGNIVAASLPTKTGYNFNGFRTSGGTEVIDADGEWMAEVSGYTDDSGNWTCSAASTLYAHWTPKPYTIRLEGMEADGENVPIDVNVTYDGVLSHVTPHTKTNYTFDGYWVRNESTHALETQLIDANGNWIKDVTGYTSSDGAGNPTWVHDYAISLYAKWTETIRTVNIAVEGEGSVQINSENVTSFNAGFVTPSAALTAVPANAAWVFKEWRFTKVEEDFQVYVADPLTYSSTSNPVVVNAIANTTLTAVFEHRYNLLGSKYEQGKDRTAMTSGGMPGWTYGSGADFTIHSYDAEGDNATVNMSYTCNLDAGTYMFEIHDRQKGESLGRKNGEAIYVLADRGSVELRGGEDKDQSIFFYPQHAGQYTFRITSMTKDGDYYYPTVTIERPHQMHFAHKRVDIDGDDHNDDLGGTLTATINGASAIDEQWFDYGSDVDWTATAETGYSLTWYTDNAYSNAMNPQPGASWSDPDITHDENIYAKFTETPTTVTLANDGHGHVEIGSGNTVTQTTVGVTTTRELTAVPNDGYMFSSWTETAKTDYSTTSTSTNPTTLRGGGTGTSSQTLTANFTYRWALSAQSDGWGQEEFTIENISLKDGKTIGYVDITLDAANTEYQFTIKDKLTEDKYKLGGSDVFFMNVDNCTDWSLSLGGDDKGNCGIKTAGAGIYRFTWNITDKTVSVGYPTSYQVNYIAAPVGGTVTAVDGRGHAIAPGEWIEEGGSVTYTATPSSGYDFAGWYTNSSFTGDPFNTDKKGEGVGSWGNSNVTETQNSYAKFISSNFVIYRAGDKAGDPRAAVDDVEEYAGGTISEAIEYRMKVHTLDQWTSLCLPFEVNAVKVWDPADGPAYFDIVPYYRTGGKFYNGHYIIRTPKTATDLAIAEFDQWNDPTSATGYVPAKNTPYIIQWHDGYFLDKYISFFGAAGQSIPSSMSSVRAAPSSDNVVNVYGNDAMVSGSVRDAYLLESDYGSSGAWLRKNIGTNRTINPFECYILANSATTTRYRILRRGATPDDTPTGWDDVCNAEPKTDIMVYTITGFPVARYYDCSFTEAAQRLHREQGEGIYILRSANESVKLMVGGQ